MHGLLEIIRNNHKLTCIFQAIFYISIRNRIISHLSCTNNNCVM